jgi:predicted metal-dependent phosphoesterase TrpH
MTDRHFKTVIHVHTNYSYDGNASCADVLETARRQRVDCVGITDHDEIAGALETRELARRDGNVQVIVGEEISSADGHIIGLFLSERIPPRLSAEETCRRIRSQGGIVLAPHPAALLCEHSLSYAAVERILPWLDGIETCNAQNPAVWENARALRFARRCDVAPYVGADTHFRGYLDAAYQLLPAFGTPAEFKVSLQQARLFPGRFPPAYFVLAGLTHYWRKFGLPPILGTGAAQHRVRAPGPLKMAEE